MAAGALTLTNHGSFAVSGAALKSKVDSINVGKGGFMSGAALYFVPIGGGQQVQVLSVDVE